MCAADAAGAAHEAASGTAERLLDAAIALGVRDGAGALSLQAIATAAGTSKALLIYHFHEKAALLRLLRERLDRNAAGRLLVASTAADAMTAWRDLVRAEIRRGELALLSALALEPASDVTAERSPSASPSTRSARDEPATRLGVALLRSVGLAPRVPARFVGRVLLRHLDGLAAAAAHRPFDDAELEAELDAFALALLGLGR